MANNASVGMGDPDRVLTCSTQARHAAQDIPPRSTITTIDGPSANIAEPFFDRLRKTMEAAASAADETREQFVDMDEAVKVTVEELAGEDAAASRALAALENSVHGTSGEVASEQGKGW